MNDDWQELRDHARNHSEEAFTRLVHQHIGMVYSSALRRTGDEHLARDITQIVFTNLARRAGSLQPSGTLAGWLYRDTQFTTMQALRGNRRRIAREQELTAMEPAPPPSHDWSRIRPLLDETLDQLSDLDRDALLLRFFAGRTIKEVATSLSIEEDAARKRISRAPEKLRAFFSRRGIQTSNEVFSEVLSTYALSSVPIGLSALVVGSAVAAASASAGAIAASTIVQGITMTKMKASLAAVILAAGVSTPLLMQHSEVKRLRVENTALQGQSNQIVQLQAENGRLQKGAIQGDNLTGEDFRELLRLRALVGSLRRQTNELTSALHSQAQVARVRQTAQPAPDDPAEPNLDEVAVAKAIIFDPASLYEAKLEALKTLRTAGARTDDVVRQMVQVYYTITNSAARADIFRQLHSTTVPEIKRPLLEAIGDPNIDPDIREEAAETLDAFLTDPDVQGWLEHAARNDPNPNVRAQARRSLERLAGP